MNREAKLAIVYFVAGFLLSWSLLGVVLLGSEGWPFCVRSSDPPKVWPAPQPPEPKVWEV